MDDKKKKRCMTFPGNPRSLQHLCRLVIRRQMTPQRLGDPDFINSGPFPPGLKGYLLYKEHDLYGRIMCQEWWSLLKVNVKEQALCVLFRNAYEVDITRDFPCCNSWVQNTFFSTLPLNTEMWILHQKTLPLKQVFMIFVQ